MSYKIKENDEGPISVRPMKINKDIIFNIDIGISKTYRDLKKTKKKILTTKGILNDLINDGNIIYRNKKLLNYNTKKANDNDILINGESNKKGNKIKISKDIIKKVNNNHDLNINNLKKKEKIKINIKEIDNYNYEKTTKTQENRNDSIIDNKTIKYSDTNRFNINNYNNKNFRHYSNEIKNNFKIETNDYNYNYNFYDHILSDSFLSMREIKRRCRQKLYRFNFDLKKYYIKIIDNIVCDANKHIVSLFKNYLIWDDPNEYFKRFYILNESQYRLNPIASYYNDYTHFFPVYFCNLEIIKILLKNVKEKTKILKEKENYENNFTIENKSISIYFEDRDGINLNISSSKKDNEIISLIDSHITKESRLSTINKNCSSLSINAKNNNGKIINIKKNQNIWDKNDKFRNSLFNINITPINKINVERAFNDSNELQKKENKKNNLNIETKQYNSILNCQKSKDNKSTKKKDKMKTDKEQSINENKNKKKDSKILNLNSINLKIMNSSARDKKYIGNLITDINETNNKVIMKNKDFFFIKKQMNINGKKVNKFKDTTHFNSKKGILRGSLNRNIYEINSLKVFKRENEFINGQISKEPTSISTINNLTQRNKIFQKRKKINNIITNIDYSSIFRIKNSNFNNNYKNKIFNLKKYKQFNSIIRNLNCNYFKLFKYSELLASNKRINSFPSKKNIEYPIRFHSLSSNKKKLLKVSDSYNSNTVLKNITTKYSYYLSHRNNNSLFNKRKNSELSYKKHRKGNSDICSLAKRNNLLINSKTHRNKKVKYNLKKSLINNKKRKKSSSQNKNYLKNIIDLFNTNISYCMLNKDNFHNNTFKNIKNSFNFNKLKAFANKRKCKSNSPVIYHKNNFLLKNKKVLNNYFVYSKKLINEKNNNNNIKLNNIKNICLKNDNNIIHKKFDKEIIKKIFKSNINFIDKIQKNHFFIKPNSPRLTSIYNINLNLNLNSQRSLNKKEIKNSNEINSTNYENKSNLNKNIKSSKILHIKQKGKLNTSKYANNSKLNQISKNNKKKNIITPDNSKKNYKNISNQFNTERVYNNIINKKENLSKKTSLNNNKIKFSKNNVKKLSFKNNLTLKNIKNNMYPLMNANISENLTERKYNKDIINNSNKKNSYTKDKKYGTKNKTLICHQIKNDKSKNIQNKKNKEDKSYKNSNSKNCFHKKSLTNITNFGFNSQENENINDSSYKIFYTYRNNNNNELSIKKQNKSNYNEFIMNHPIKTTNYKYLFK